VPVFPGLVSWSLAHTKNALIAGAPDSTAHNHDGDNSRAL
jgi:hypothetical protein